MPTDEETATTIKGGGNYGRIPVSEQDDDWVDEPLQEEEEEKQEPDDGDGVVVLTAGGSEGEEMTADEQDGIFRDDGTQSHAGSARQRRGSTHSSTGSSSPSSNSSWWNARLLPDDRFSICGVNLLDGPPAVKLLKFIAVTFGAICFMYKFIRFMNWEHKKKFTLERFWTYESTEIVSDAMVFFVVARLWKQRGVDQLSWLFWLFASNIFMSVLPQFKFLQESFTLYNMHCTWSWKLWAFVVILAPLVVFDILLHVHYAVRHGFFARKLLELVMAVLFWFLPYASSPYFHLHHWFAGWWVGMHANFDTWWSRATLAWCWGMYINGIAAYGRDPVLTCGYAFFISEQNRCPFLDCYMEGINTPKPDTNETVPLVKPMVKPDWRNCSADAYHP